MKLALHQIRYDLLAFVRNREAVFFTVALPVIFLLIFATVFGNDDVKTAYGTIKQSTSYVPNLMALAITSASIQSLVIGVITQREQGILKRRRSTPVPAWVLIIGRAATAVMTSYGNVVVLGVIGRVLYGVKVPLAALPAIILVVGIGSATLCCVGYAISTLIRTEEAANPILQATVLPLYFISGVFFPEDSVPNWLLSVADVFPIRHLSQALLAAYVPGGDSRYQWGHLGILALWGAVGLAVAARRFKWVPQGR